MLPDAWQKDILMHEKNVESLGIFFCFFFLSFYLLIEGRNSYGNHYYLFHGHSKSANKRGKKSIIIRLIKKSSFDINALSTYSLFFPLIITVCTFGSSGTAFS